MKILVIAPIFYPYNNPRAFRWTAITKEWATKGHDVQVLTSKGNQSPYSDPPEKEIIVHRVFYNSLKEILFRTKKTNSVNDGINPDIKKGLKHKIIQFINQYIWKNIFFPDDACIWYLPALNRAKKLQKRNHFDLIVSVGLPFTSHLIAKHIKEKNPKLTWIMDIGDPFSLQAQHPINNYLLFSYFNRKLERNVLEMADIVSVTNEGCKQLYFEEFTGLQSNIIVVPPLYHSLSKHPSNDIELEPGKIHLAYFGRFFSKIREPYDAFELIALAISRYPQPSNQLQIHFFGDGYEAYEHIFQQFPKLRARMVFHGLIPRGLVAEYMVKMDFLINFGNATTFQLPSKSVDYMASGKPIINFHVLKEDTFKSFFKTYPNIINLFVSEKNWQEENIRSFVSFLWSMKNKKIPSVNVERLMQSYSPACIAQEFLSDLKV